MVDVHPVRQQLPVNKPAFIAFYAVSNLYKGQEMVSE